jgi:4'-phosphopantetheinyl transferase EntD
MDRKAADLETRLESDWDCLLPPYCLHRTAFIQDFSKQLTASEIELLSGSRQRRIDEFSTSRFLARSLIPSTGDNSILMDEEGVPLWPDGWAGSISHCKGLCSVALLSLGQPSAIGIDIEQLGRLSDRGAQRVLSPDEQQKLQRWAQAHQFETCHIPTLAFSLKEAYFKFQFPATRRWLGFHDVILHPDSNGELSIRETSAPRESVSCTLRFKESGNYLLSAVFSETSA